jgi:hypothetical protein
MFLIMYINIYKLISSRLQVLRYYLVDMFPLQYEFEAFAAYLLSSG